MFRRKAEGAGQKWGGGGPGRLLAGFGADPPRIGRGFFCRMGGSEVNRDEGGRGRAGPVEGVGAQRGLVGRGGGWAGEKGHPGGG